MRAKPPIAKKIPHQYTIHNNTITDNYHWLRDFNWPKVSKEDVLEYLEAENNHAAHFFDPKKDLLDKIYKDLIGRIKLDDISTPMRDENYYYYSITKATLDYSILARKDKNGKEEILLDKNEEAKGEKYYRVGAVSISPDENLMAYSTDTSGDEHFKLKIKDLRTNKFLSDELENIMGDAVWNETGEGFYYTKLDDKWRPNTLYYHKLGTDQKDDILLYKEEDHIFRIGVGITTDRAYIILGISSSTSSEIRYMKSDGELPKK